MVYEYYLTGQFNGEICRVALEWLFSETRQLLFPVASPGPPLKGEDVYEPKQRVQAKEPKLKSRS